MNTIPIRAETTLDRIARKALYKLPGDPSRDLYVIPVSGGADSSALAVTLTRLFPETAFLYYFSDTRAEDPELYDQIDALEQYLGISVHRDVPEAGLFEKIDEYNGFLPSHQARWCTRELKIKPLEAWAASIAQPGATIHTFVGIRADEDRTGYLTHHPSMATHMPFKDLGMGRDEVYGVCMETVGLPRFYAFRTRSGCSTCPFQRRSEVLALLRRQPAEFAKGEDYEKLADEDVMRWADVLPAYAEVAGTSHNHTRPPTPADWTPRAQPRQFKRDSAGTGDLFSAKNVTLYVGVEFFLLPDGETWWWDFVSFGTTRSSIHRQLAGHYHHRMKIPESHLLDREEMARELRLVVYTIELPADRVSTAGPGPDSYTWRSSDAYAQLRHLYSWAAYCLLRAGDESLVRRTLGAGGFWGEYRDLTREGLSRAEAQGSVAGWEVFQPPAEEPEEDEREVRCLACSV